MPQMTEALPNWLSSFPHVVAPYPDEWFAGLLLRYKPPREWNYLALSSAFDDSSRLWPRFLITIQKGHEKAGRTG